MCFQKHPITFIKISKNGLVVREDALLVVRHIGAALGEDALRKTLVPRKFLRVHDELGGQAAEGCVLPAAVTLRGGRG